MYNKIVIVLNKKQLKAVNKWRKGVGYNVNEHNQMSFPFYVSLEEKPHATAVGYEHIYQPQMEKINFNQFLQLSKIKSRTSR